jgi:hypothetical protein
VRTTEIYTHVSRLQLQRIRSPLDASLPENGNERERAPVPDAGDRSCGRSTPPRGHAPEGEIDMGRMEP